MSVVADSHPDQPVSLSVVEPVSVTTGGARGVAGGIKRGIDIVAVVATLPLTIPLFVVLAVAVKLSSPGPVLYRQERVGRGGRRFTMWKFRTMHVDAEQRLRSEPGMHARYLANDYKLHAADDPRIIGIGRFLRASSLDELPQLCHVLSGKMSLVGPRPVVPDELVSYGSHTSAYLRMRPGLTGRWQCAGRSNIRYPERAVLDAEYVETWSLWNDAVILVRTIPAVWRRHGAH